VDVKLSGLKKCPKCGINYSISNFYKDFTTDDNLSFFCKDCVKKYFKQFKKPKNGKLAS
jgi:hypothetical protein